MAAVALAIAALAVVVWFPSLLARLLPDNVVIAQCEEGSLVLCLEHEHRSALGDIRSIETKLAFWPGARNRIIVSATDGAKELRTAIDYVPLFRALDALGSRLGASGEGTSAT